ncbi:hypothetical protein [uncultured Sphingopyxis sp.]|uniref:hypothetical protein n=1 Tax=uncultured Sphingopyxis sp. TaxID=310581 RepID=UPI0025963218|nr:hypothetical protein [uncultured Sphingopyxis sp.]
MERSFAGLVAGLCPACPDVAPRTPVRQEGEGDAEPLALGLDPGQFGRRCLRTLACLTSCALVAAQLVGQLARAIEKIGAPAHQGSAA